MAKQEAVVGIDVLKARAVKRTSSAMQRFTVRNKMLSVLSDIKRGDMDGLMFLYGTVFGDDLDAVVEALGDDADAIDDMLAEVLSDQTNS